jgi:hypothetical protein
MQQSNGCSPRHDGVLYIPEEILRPFNLRIAKSAVSDAKHHIIRPRVSALQTTTHPISSAQNPRSRTLSCMHGPPPAPIQHLLPGFTDSSSHSPALEFEGHQHSLGIVRSVSATLEPFLRIHGSLSLSRQQGNAQQRDKQQLPMALCR